AAEPHRRTPPRPARPPPRGGGLGDHQRACLGRPVEPGCGAGLSASALSSPLTAGGMTPGGTATGGVITGGTPAGALVVGTGGACRGGGGGVQGARMWECPRGPPRVT